MKLICICFLLVSINSFGQFEIGQTSIVFNDTERDREVESFIYYPAAVAGEDVSLADGEFPVIAVGHGFVMTYEFYTYLWEHFVPLGYIVVLPNTETTIAVSHADYGQDLSFVISALQDEGANASSLFFNHVTSKSAVIGHSMGGGAAVLAAASNEDISTLVTLAAAETDPSAISAALSVSQPSITFAGGADCVTPPAEHQELIYENLNDCKAYVLIPDGSHCQFAESNPLCEFGEFSCPDAEIVEEAQHAAVLEVLTPWLAVYLKNDFSAWLELELLVGDNGNYNLELNCDENGPSLFLDEAIINEAVIYPNPTIGIVNVSANVQNRSYQVFSIDGRLVQRGIATNQIDLSDLLTGTYLIRIENQDGTQSFNRIQKL